MYDNISLDTVTVNLKLRDGPEEVSRSLRLMTQILQTQLPWNSHLANYRRANLIIQRV